MATFLLILSALTRKTWMAKLLQVGIDGHIVKFSIRGWPMSRTRKTLLLFYDTERMCMTNREAGGATSSHAKCSSTMDDDTRSACCDVSFSIRAGVVIIAAKRSSQVLPRPLSRVLPLPSGYCDSGCYCACEGLGVAVKTVCAWCLSAELEQLHC